MKQDLFSRRLLALVAGIGSMLAAIAASAAPAQAALLGSSCPTAQFSQPFAPWGDSSSYELVPGGSFENGLGGWTVSGGAKIVSGGEPFRATGSASTASLYLPAGATAQSPAVCVNAAYPTMRFFALNAAAGSSVTVQVVYPGLGGLLQLIPVGSVSGQRAWAPTPVLQTQAAIASVLTLGNAQVSLRFTAGGGASQVDDVFIDPRMAR